MCASLERRVCIRGNWISLDVVIVAIDLLVVANDLMDVAIKIT